MSARTQLGHGLLWAVCAAWAASVIWWAVAGRHERPRPVAARPPAPDPFAADAELFPAKRPPGPHDWMAVFHEPHQSFADFLAGDPLRRTEARKAIALLPLGAFDAEETALLEEIRQAVAAFFQVEARVLPAVALPSDGLRRTPAAPGGKQYLTTALMDGQLRPRLPQDALCLLGITNADLYPESSWNFVFGEARGRLGVYSLARLHPEAERIPGGVAPPDGGPDARLLLRRRAVQIVLHEAGHILGLAHCIRSECLMNGANTLEESDRGPLEPCPLCLKKLHWSLRFDVRARYAVLRDLYARLGFTAESEWLGRRLQRLGPP